MKYNLLIIDDDLEIKNQLKWALKDQYQLEFAGSYIETIEILKNCQPNVIVLDLGLPPNPNSPEEGFKILNEVKEIIPEAKVIVVSGQSDKMNALQSIRDGASDFLMKPVDINELLIVLNRTFYIWNLERENKKLRLEKSTHGFHGLAGSCDKMLKVFRTIEKVADSDAPVMILGESGTGKEVVAKSIHNESKRKDNPFIAINCGAIPENLLESELFGHEKGSFTGAHSRKSGKFELVCGGTLFLDEIGELSTSLQVKLLRVLQDFKFNRVGGNDLLKMEGRIIAATNADLMKLVAEGTFREDLFYRLAVIKIDLPPLRERGKDLELLCKLFLDKYVNEYKQKPLRFSKSAINAIVAYNWPGNVRELENKLKRAVIMAESNRISIQDLDLNDDVGIRFKGSLKEIRENAERTAIISALEKSRGKITQAANELQISRPTLYELMEKLKITKNQKTN